MTKSTTKLRPLLQATEFGDDVAEFDQHLSSYFVETSSFLDIVGDRADLILGEKGSGKSAIFRHLANPDADIPQLENVDIVPAFNVQGSVIFRRLSHHGVLPEDAYRFVWFTFIAGMIANHIVSTYKDIIDTGRLEKLLQLANLQVEQPFVPRLWEKIEGIIESISSRLEVEGELEFAIPTLPVKAKAKGRLRPAHDKSRDGSETEVDLEQILYLCNESFSQMDRRCWILFDRLDEAFEHDRDLESLALRGLLRAHLDVASFRFQLRTKLFLRNDVMERITERAGFVNATHLRRHHLQWDAEGITDLIARRIVTSDVISKLFQIRSEELRAHSTRLAICHHILPESVGLSPLIEWFEENTIDPKGSLNPRNIISLLRFARQYQLAVYDRDDPDYDPCLPLITEQAMERGFADLSNARLKDTVLAEFQSLRPIIQRLRTKKPKLPAWDVARVVGCKQDSPAYQRVVQTLCDAGVVSKVKSGNGGIVIARLYRPALNMTSGTPELTSADKADLRELVDSKIRTWSGSEVTLGTMVRDERKFVQGYVTQAYPTYSTKAIGTPNPEIMRVVLTEKNPKDNNSVTVEGVFKDGE